MLVRNLVSERSNREVANQFVIENGGDVYFQSYQSVVAKVASDGTVTFGPDWNYSKTTTKHLNGFLKEYAPRFGYMSANEKRKAIKNGLIKFDADM